MQGQIQSQNEVKSIHLSSDRFFEIIINCEIER